MTSPVERIAHALHRERHRAGISLSELARQAGVSKATVSQLEAGTGNPSVETLWALATALGVPFSVLVDPPPSDSVLVRRGERSPIASSTAAYSATLLSAGTPGVRRDLYLLEGEPGTPRASMPHPTGTVEHLVLASGRALAGPTETPAELEPGDYLVYRGDEPHTFEALAPGTLAVLVSEQS
ncbi:helix-turn-helix domain-containing protein [Agromyces archimandritae]|uniref:Helix-turn-helix transcriptional regulator n=1 Tax=Agromyces archimandritae TaxID=2781962 RepID=A0A975FRH7_9MICO|nr:XRE family transcriptional regulator [Agromyces archimandritae]QTX05896.1 helix-turn-helix transcriptional regulator [Agromyces archimandritae]